MILLGIDPGAKGAFAFLDGDTGQLLDVQDMPTARVAVGKSEKVRVSPTGVVGLLAGMGGTDCTAFMERLVAMPSKADPLTGQRRSMGAASMGQFFRGGGVIEGVLAALGIGLTEVEARTWKAVLRCPREKEGSVERACQMFPLFAGRFRYMHAGRPAMKDGRAEAAMIAEYGRRTVARPVEAALR